MSLKPKLIAELLNVSDFKRHFSNLVADSHSASEKILKLSCLLERMISAVIDEIFIEQLETPYDDRGLLSTLRSKVIMQYWRNKGWQFLDLLYKSSKSNDISLRNGLTIKDIDATSQDCALYMAKKIRHFVAHNADISFSMDFDGIARESKVSLTIKEFEDSIEKAINVLHAIYAIVPLKKLEEEMDALAAEAEAERAMAWYDTL